MPDLVRLTTGVSRRHTHTGDEPAFASNSASNRIEAQPALATIVPRPFGDLSVATPQLIGQLAYEAPPTAAARTAEQHRASTRRILAYLGGFEGGTWQQRWDASPWAAARSLPLIWAPTGPGRSTASASGRCSASVSSSRRCW